MHPLISYLLNKNAVGKDFTVINKNNDYKVSINPYILFEVLNDNKDNLPNDFTLSSKSKTITIDSDELFAVIQLASITHNSMNVIADMSFAFGLDVDGDYVSISVVHKLKEVLHYET